MDKGTVSSRLICFHTICVALSALLLCCNKKKLITKSGEGNEINTHETEKDG